MRYCTLIINKTLNVSLCKRNKENNFADFFVARCIYIIKNFDIAKLAFFNEFLNSCEI